MATNDKLGEHTPLAGLVLLDSNHQRQVTTTRSDKTRRAHLILIHSLAACPPCRQHRERFHSRHSGPFPHFLSSRNGATPEQHVGEQPNLASVVHTTIPITWSLANRRVQTHRCRRRVEIMTTMRFMSVWPNITMGHCWVHPSSSVTTHASRWVLLTFRLLFTFFIGVGGGVLIGTRE